MALQNAFENLAVESKQDAQITKLDTIISNQLPDDHNVTISNQIDTSNLALNSTLESVKTSIDSLPILPDNHSVTVSNQPTGYATSVKQDDLLTELQKKADLTETQPVNVTNQISEISVNNLPTDYAKESKQLLDGHNVNVANIEDTPLITGFATESKQDTQIEQIAVLTHENIHTGDKELRVYQQDHICIPNSTSTPLGINGTFIGDWQDTHGFAEIILSVNADQNSLTDGVVVEWSSDGITKHEDDVFTLYANKGKTWSFPANRRYVRVKYTNDSVAQTMFNLETTLKVHASKGSSHRLKDSLVEDDDAIVTKSFISGKTTAGGGAIVDVKVNPSGALTVESTVSSSALPTGASTSALQTTANTKLDDVVNAVENLNINLSNQGYAKVEPTAYTRIHGTYISGDIESVKVQDNRYLVIQELAGNGLTVDFDFILPTDKKAEQIVFKGQYNGSLQHWCDIYAYDWQQAQYIMLTNSTNRFSSTSEDITVQLEVFNNNFTDASGNVKIRIQHNNTTYINTHQLQINYVHVAYLSALDFQIEGVATEETLLKTVKTMFIGDVTITPSSDATNDYYVKTGTTNVDGIDTQTITINKTTGVVTKIWS